MAGNDEVIIFGIHWNSLDPATQILLIIIAVTLTLYIIYIGYIKETLYEKIFERQADKLGKFIQGRKIKDITGNITDNRLGSPNAGWYRRGVLCCKYILVELEEETNNNQNKNKSTKLFRLFKLKIVYRNKLGYDIEIKTSQNHPNEPLITIYVPDEDYYDRMHIQQRKQRQQEKYEKQMQFIKEEYTTTYESKGE